MVVTAEVEARATEEVATAAAVMGAAAVATAAAGDAAAAHSGAWEETTAVAVKAVAAVAVAVAMAAAVTVAVVATAVEVQMVVVGLAAELVVVVMVVAVAEGMVESTVAAAESEVHRLASPADGMVAAATAVAVTREVAPEVVKGALAELKVVGSGRTIAYRVQPMCTVGSCSVKAESCSSRGTILGCTPVRGCQREQIHCTRSACYRCKHLALGSRTRKMRCHPMASPKLPQDKSSRRAAQAWAAHGGGPGAVACVSQHSTSQSQDRGALEAAREVTCSITKSMGGQYHGGNRYRYRYR